MALQHCTWGYFTQRNHQQKAQKCEKGGATQTAKRTLVCSLMVETKAKYRLFHHSWECIHWVTHVPGHVTMRVSADAKESATSTDLGVTNTL